MWLRLVHTMGMKNIHAMHDGGGMKSRVWPLKKWHCHPIPPNPRVGLSPQTRNTRNLLKIHRKCQVFCFLSANIRRYVAAAGPFLVNAQCRSWQATRCTMAHSEGPVFRRHKWLDLHDACSTTRRLAGDKKRSNIRIWYEILFSSAYLDFIVLRTHEIDKNILGSDRHPMQNKCE